MTPEAFVILCAGRGTRMQDVALVNKALLPLHNRPVLDHVICHAPVEMDVIIAVGYQQQAIIDYCTLAYPDRNITFVEQGDYTSKNVGPGTGLLACEEAIAGRPFYLITNDCVITTKLPDLSGNWLGVEKVEDPLPWCTVKTKRGRVVEVINKSAEGTDTAFIGVAGIAQPEVFWPALKNNDTREFIYGFTGFDISSPLHVVFLPWVDTGMPGNYQAALETPGPSPLSLPKRDQFFYVVGDQAIKYFHDIEKIPRILRCHQRDPALPSNVSQLGNFLYYPLKKGRTLYESPLDSIAEFLVWIEDFWARGNYVPDADNFFDACYDFYRNKTAERMCSIEQVPDVFDKIPWEVVISQCRPCQFHGDLQLDNVLEHPGEVPRFTLLDPRGSFALYESCGDMLYDLAKMHASARMRFDDLKVGRKPRSWPEAVDLVEEYAVSQGFNLKVLQILSSLVYLNMAPLHPDPIRGTLLKKGTEDLCTCLSMFY